MTIFDTFVAGLLTLGLCVCAQADVAPAPTHTVLESIQHFLVIPSTVAQVTDMNLSMDAAQMPEFILIQDVHKHPEVQRNVASLILQGYAQWGVRKVFVEGAFTGVDLSMFHRLPEQTRDLLLSRLVQEGNLSGAEFASVLLTESEWSNPQPCPFQLFGMEDAQLYRQNISAYREVLSLRDNALGELLSIRRLQNEIHIPQPNILAQQLDRTEALIKLKMTPSDFAAYKGPKAQCGLSGTSPKASACQLRAPRACGGRISYDIYGGKFTRKRAYLCHLNSSCDGSRIRTPV
jgi:hypothetical protein